VSQQAFSTPNHDIFALFAHLSARKENERRITSYSGQKESGKRGNLLHVLRNSAACRGIMPGKTGFHYFCDKPHKNIDRVNSSAYPFLVMHFTFIAIARPFPDNRRPLMKTSLTLTSGETARAPVATRPTLRRKSLLWVNSLLQKLGQDFVGAGKRMY
jgi:hypothetical protein